MDVSFLEPVFAAPGPYATVCADVTHISENADTEPLFVPPCALDTYRWCGSVGENSLPNGPAASAGNGDPAAAEPAAAQPEPPAESGTGIIE